MLGCYVGLGNSKVLHGQLYRCDVPSGCACVAGHLGDCKQKKKPCAEG